MSASLGFKIPKFASLPPYQQVSSLHGGDYCAVCCQGRHEGGYLFCPHFRAMRHKDQLIVADTMKRLTREKSRRRQLHRNPHWKKGGQKKKNHQKRQQESHHVINQSSQAAIGLALAREQRQFAEAVGNAVGRMGNVPGGSQQNQKKRK